MSQFIKDGDGTVHRTSQQTAVTRESLLETVNKAEQLLTRAKEDLAQFDALVTPVESPTKSPADPAASIPPAPAVPETPAAPAPTPPQPQPAQTEVPVLTSAPQQPPVPAAPAAPINPAPAVNTPPPQAPDIQ